MAHADGQMWQVTRSTSQHTILGFLGLGSGTPRKASKIDILMASLLPSRLV